MGVEPVRKTLTQRLDSPVEVGTYRGADGVWAKVKIDPRINNSMRPTSLICDGTVVEEMKVRFVSTSDDRSEVIEALDELEALTPASGEITAKNHELATGNELWPHIFYEKLALSEAVSCLVSIEAEPLPTY